MCGGAAAANDMIFMVRPTDREHRARRRWTTRPPGLQPGDRGLRRAAADQREAEQHHDRPRRARQHERDVRDRVTRSSPARTRPSPATRPRWRSDYARQQFVSFGASLHARRRRRRRVHRGRGRRHPEDARARTCVLWLDAADEDYLTHSMGDVSSWRDKSGRRESHHAGHGRSLPASREPQPGLRARVQLGRRPRGWRRRQRPERDARPVHRRRAGHGVRGLAADWHHVPLGRAPARHERGWLPVSASRCRPNGATGTAKLQYSGLGHGRRST